MKKLYTLLTIIIILNIGNIAYIRHSGAETKPINHSLEVPYRNCTPNEPVSDSRTKHQQAIVDTAKQMTTLNSRPGDDPELQILTQKYNDLISKYDTCKVIDPEVN